MYTMYRVVYTALHSLATGEQLFIFLKETDKSRNHIRLLKSKPAATLRIVEVTE